MRPFPNGRLKPVEVGSILYSYYIERQSQLSLARKYGVNNMTVHNAVHGKAWVDIYKAFMAEYPHLQRAA